MIHYHFRFATARYPTPQGAARARSNKPNALIAVLIVLCLTATVSQVKARELIVRSLSEIESGALLFQSGTRNHYLRAPLLQTHVEIGVQGLLSRTIVEQQFTNDSVDWMEGIYAFPLPDNATVDELTMIIGESKIEGVIQTREKARSTYETAKKAGKKSSLLEQQRPNLFTTKVANIPPGESIGIRISYQSAVRYVDGQFDLAFPLTITPRYLPGSAIPVTYDGEALSASTSSGWQTLEKIQDAEAITPPITDIAAPVSISVSLDTGLNGLTIESATHDIVTTRLDAAPNEIVNVELATNTVPANRDFKLSWTPQISEAPVAAVFQQDKTRNGSVESFASVMLLPPQQMFSESIPPREVIFVIDTSGSMQGDSIRQARRMLALGIDRLSTDDYFNVIAFNGVPKKLFSSSVPATDNNKTQSIRQVENLDANGGTEILRALTAALETAPVEERLRQIVFVTDGSVGNENEIFAYLNKNIGASRLFTVGIGSAPNTWFMRKSAELGRGTYINIANTSELAKNALTLLAKLERPALTNVSIKFKTDNQPEVFPVIMPDVYMGEPVLADARWINGFDTGEIEVTGAYNGQPWSQVLNLASIQNGDADDPAQSTQGVSKGLDKLWATRKIQTLEDTLLFSNNHEQVEKAVTDIALDYSMVTKYTSLVAVEDKVSRIPGVDNLYAAAVPQAIPSGNTMHYPQGSLGTTLRLMIASIFALLAILLAISGSPQRLGQAAGNRACPIHKRPSTPPGKQS